VAARLGWELHLRAVDPKVTTSADTKTYVGPAKALLEDGRLTEGPDDPGPIFIRTPGYPLCVAAIFAVTADSGTAVLVVQIVLSLVTAWLAFVIAAALWGELAGISAAAFNVLDITRFTASGAILTETLAALALLAFVGIGYRVASGRPPLLRWAALMGLALAGGHSHPADDLLPLLHVALVIVIGFWRAGTRSWAPVVSIFLVPVIVLIGGWQIRNRREVDSFRFSGIDAYNLYTYRAAGTLAIENGTSLAEEQARLRKQLVSKDANTEIGRRYDRMFDEGLEIVLDHPVAAARMTAEGIGKAWSRHCRTRNRARGAVVQGAGGFRPSIASCIRAMTSALVTSPRVRSSTPRSASVARRRPPVSASG
jgi:hypothetical protein